MNSYNFILVDDITDNNIYNEIILNDINYYKNQIRKINTDLEYSARSTICHFTLYSKYKYYSKITLYKNIIKKLQQKLK